MPDEDERKNLNGLMGMVEMEDALAVALRKARAQKCTLRALKLGPDDFLEEEPNPYHTPRRPVLIGFCHLLYSGWLRRGDYNGEFRMTDGLLARLDHAGIKV